jgi:hypothetical protein
METENQQYYSRFGMRYAQASVIENNDTLLVAPKSGSWQDKADYSIDDYYGLQLDSN